ncbi:MAG: tetraacyldisaccharide 4'-kinase, partial [Candidatus Omnitrophica bacterium]|nr:tetraacyldisaccharide 4'-kinase [Candidatus Omnitrophota bacterium]
MKIRSSRPYFKKVHDYLIFIQNNNIFFCIWAAFFYPLSLFWILGCYIKLICTKKKCYGVPVISVGNIELGGTGKTPLTIKIGKFVETFLPHIFVVSYAKNTTSADEPILISRELKKAEVIYGKNRRALFSSVIKKNPDLIIIDDGFQYFDIQNKLDIILINPETPVNFIIPAGRMRFPFNFIKYADAIVINESCQKKASNEKIIKGLKESGKPVFTAKYAPSHFVDLKNEKVSLTI